MQGSSGIDLLLIRHAHSKANQASVHFAAKYNTDKATIKKNPQFEKQVKYSMDYLDSEVTEQGYQQLKQIKPQVQKFNPDLILVSPLNRCLITCSELFPNPTCPVIVEPILSARQTTASDCSCELSQKISRFPNYDFSKVQALGPYWVFSNDSEENRAKYNEVIQKNKDKGFKQTMEAICEFRVKTKLTQSLENIRQRVQKTKELLKEYRKKYQRIVAISSAKNVRVMLAKEFDPNGEPLILQVKNGQVREAVINELPIQQLP